MTISDVRLAADLAARAGEVLLRLRAGSGLTGAELGKRGDADANAFLLAELARQRPADAVLSEESADSPARLSADRVWIIDPLDGTREYGLPGRADWAVHVALWQRRGDPVGSGGSVPVDAGPAGAITAGAGPVGAGPAGADPSGSVPAGAITDAAVAQPALGTVYDTARTHGDRTPASAGVARPKGPANPVVLVSASRPPRFAAAVAEAVSARLEPMGSAGAKAMAVVRGEALAYVHAGGQWEWDSAAPVAVARAAGLHTCRADGTPLRYNQPHPYLPDLVICRADLAERVLAAITASVG